VLEIGRTSAEGASVERRKREDRGAERGRGVGRECPHPYWKAPSPEKKSIFELEKVSFVHSGCYFCS